jgi:hypothetical protein
MSRGVASATCAGWLAAVLIVSSPLRAQEPGKVEASAATYVRTDTDRTTVVTPRLQLAAPITEETRVDLSYTVDVWTSASIDIRTSASIGVDSEAPQYVTEQRDEIDVALEHALGDVTLGASYRYSVEHDYESNGGSIGGAYNFADNSATLALSLRAYFDDIGRAGAPSFEENATLYSARLAFTQVIDPETLVQLVYEGGISQGYLSSPYRYVRFAPAGSEVESRCVRSLTLCLPENNPDSKLRHALALSGRRALSDALSAGASYRFYLDSWDMTSHTIGVDGTLAPEGGWLFSLGYRFYLQSSASHFENFYVAMPLPESYTSDKELSSLSSHRLELEMMKSFQLDDLGSEFATVLLISPSYFSYDEFLLLESITALEVTLALEVSL